ncbi:MAG: tRNA pseudouridine(55) synthase TruB [Nitrospirae bacterium]|nr:MAG: tRNA pseudouridine(55) synthase TruB [Nitrospirota bacterium]
MELDLVQGTETAVDGVLVVNKPAGWTSHDVVAKARALLGGAKVGHTGTLDPAATGVLLLCLGKATRIAEYLVQADKEYRAVLRLGVATDTQDATGAVTARAEGALPDRAAIDAVMGRFVGRHRQVPPMYSAVKIQGVPLYKSARAGRTVDRPAREYTVHSLKILSVTSPAESAVVGVGGAPLAGPPSTLDVTFDVVCSKGTYVRTLCADIGEALGVGGHLAALERRRIGRFGLEDAVTLDDLAALAGRDAVGTRLHSLDAALAGVPVLTLDPRAADGVRHGIAVPAAQVSRMEGDWAAGACVRLQAPDGRLLAIGKVPCGPDELRQAAPGTVITLEKVLA